MRKFIIPLLFTISSFNSLIFILEKFYIVSIVLIPPLFYLFYKQKLINNIWVYFSSLILSIFIWLQNCNQFIWNGHYPEVKLIMTPICTFIFFLYFISFLYYIFEKYSHYLSEKKANNKLLFVIGFCIIIISWIPAWIAEYPNSLNPDTIAQFAQIFNIQPYSNGNPLLHTFLLKILFSFFALFTKNNNTNIACISVVFSILNALTFSYASVYAYKRSNKFPVYLFSIIFYSFISHNVFFGIQISKDTTFSIFTILFIISIDKFFIQQNKKNTIILLIIGFLFSLLRLNGYYMILVTFIVAFLFFKRISFRKVVLILLLIFILSNVTTRSIYPQIVKIANADIKTGSTNKTTGVNMSTKNIIPLQQISLYVYKDYSLTDKQEELIRKMAPLDLIKENYNMYFADPMLKTCVKYGDKSFYQVDKIEYYKLYFELFAKHPFDFIEAYCGMTNVYFYPFLIEMNLYSINMPNNDFGFKKTRLISEEYSKTVESIYRSQFKIPILKLLLSPGVYTFFIIIALFYFLYSYQYNKFICLVPLVTNILILITVVPINAEFRYYLPISVCMPLIIGFLLSKETTN